MQIRLGDRVLDCDGRTAIMAVLNVATDSPVRASVVAVPEAVARAEALRDAGAAIIDVGAHSTRTGGEAVGPDEEIARLCPVIEALRREGQLISVDTWTAGVAAAALAAGAHLINDVSAAADPAMAAVVAAAGAPILIMHMRGAPKQHRTADQHYADIATEVRAHLAERAAALEAAGVRAVWLDPGFAFAKSAADNVRLLRGLPRLLELGRPVVISASRKAFLAEFLGAPPLGSEEAQAVPYLREATVAFNVLAAYLGAHLVRVHDVGEVAAALRVVEAVRRVAPGG